MKMIILAAGQGTRLSPLTDDKPKCMVPFNGKPIIDYIIDTAEKCGIENINIVHGYKRDILESHLKDKQINFFYNDLFDNTNMVASLFYAQDAMDDDVIISYSDIVYKEGVLRELMEAEGKVNVVVDKKWHDLWSIRMENPLDDAETLKIENGCIKELGKKPSSLNDIEGQYIGLIKFTKEVIAEIKTFYKELDKSEIYDGKDYSNMYMTSFIQMIIDKLYAVKPTFIEGGWLEVDCLKDLQVYQEKGLII